ncbi:MAG: HAD family hydrolase [Clostridia bacterium]|nr:HAD family hydrolase [Clostridia bacterium]
MSIELIALDMDGTLLDSNKNMPEDFLPWVRKHKNIKTVIASGRQYYTIIRDFPSSKDDLIIVAENGALVYERGNMLYMNSMDKADAHRAVELTTQIPGAVPIVCGRQSAYLTDVCESTYNQTAVYYDHVKRVKDLHLQIDRDDILKIAVFFENHSAESALHCFSNLGGKISAILSGERWIDIANTAVNKGNAISFIMNKFDIKPSEAMAFGDYLNDRTMLEVCDESYCMENGHPDLKAIAKHIARSNDDNGVMRVLYENTELFEKKEI